MLESDISQPYVEVTLTAIKGSAPQVVGARMFVTLSGRVSGTVGGGKIEAHSTEYAKSLILKNGVSCSETWNLQKDIGMSCGGEVTLFFKTNLKSKWNICVYGAGHITQELTRILINLDCQIRVLDSRQEWLEKLPTSPRLEKKQIEIYSEGLDDLPIGTALLSITMGHSTDLPVLSKALQTPEKFSFIGVIGSDIKGKKLRAELLGKYGSQTEKIVCPLGLPIGNNSPEEIAVSVASQLLAVRDGVTIGVI